MNEFSRVGYEKWLGVTLEDVALVEELESIKGDDEAINDRFYRELEFGTGGLRGVLGVGTNRMNIYTVGKASAGLANYVNSLGKATPSIAIAYDSRINSDVFARRAASVFAGHGIKVYIWRELMPTPSLSFALRYLGASAGIVVTASHNPSKYNGYKVYGSDGCQITNEAADAILAEIGKVDAFSDVKTIDFEEGIGSGAIEYIKEEVFDAFIDAVSSQSFIGDDVDKSAKIVYTPLYGAGLRCVTTVLAKNGFCNVEVVKEQSQPNGHFPTAPYPNPEIREALEVGLSVAKEKQADLLMATDPDCDRVGIAVRFGEDFKLLSGNEVGVLLLDFIAKRRLELDTMPTSPVLVKTIVSIDLADRIATDYGIETRNVLTGFKYIGEQIAALEAEGRADRYIFGFEESYGYLSGSYVRDKDAVNAAFLIAQMFAYYNTRNQSLLDILDGLYDKYGYYLNTLHSFEFDGESGMKKMAGIMESFRNQMPATIAGLKVLEVRDYQLSEIIDIKNKGITKIDLPKSNVIKYMLEGNSSVVLRPSGTEPKLKLYLSINHSDREAAASLEKKMAEEMKGYMA